MSTSLMW